MYKVFVNDNCINFSNLEVENTASFLYENEATFNFILNKLKSEIKVEFTIFHKDLDLLWNDFKNFCQSIEAAGGLVLNSNQEILCIKRLGKWDLPKGKIEKDEDIREAAIREVAEECNVNDCTIEKELITTFHIYYINEKPILKSTHWFLMHSLSNEKLIPQTEEGIEEVVWKSSKELKEIYQNTYQNIILVLDLYLT